MTRKFRPANGTEGEDFICAWCCHCERDTEQDCAILAATFRYEVDDPAYPVEWIEDPLLNRPVCTAFVPLGAPVPPPRCQHTEDMFAGETACPPDP